VYFYCKTNKPCTGTGRREYRESWSATSDVNKDLTFKAKDKTLKAKDQTSKDKDQTFKAKDKD